MTGKDVNWTEGLFVQPHHFQQAFLNADRQVSALAAYTPFYHGLAKLNFSQGECQNYTFHITELDCRFPDGTRVNFPGNAVIEKRAFKEFIDSNEGKLDVFLGLPSISEGEPNCLRPNDSALGGRKYRYESQEVECPDLVTGKNPRPVEVKLLRPRILFSGETQAGYDVLPIARLEMVDAGQEMGSRPKAVMSYAPPSISVDASNVLSEIVRDIGARLLSRNRMLRDYWKSKDTASLMKARDAFKVQAIAVASNTYKQLAAAPGIHPFAIYCKMAEIIGQLSIYCEDDRYVSAPPYDHDNLGVCFATAQENLLKLLSYLEESSYESRVFEQADQGLRCPMEPAWLEDRFDLFICFVSGLDEADVKGRVDGLKTAPENLIPVLNQRRIRGMTLEGPLHHLPSLPTSNNHHYYKIPRDGTYFPKLKEFPSLGIWGPTDFTDVVTLYIVERNKS